MKMTMKMMMVALAALVPGVSMARTKLVTLPDRAQMVVSLHNPQLPLLYEEREIPLQKGANFIDFSWNGVNIDPDSVMVEMLTHPGDDDAATRIIATGFPPNENALTWQVYSPEARTERIRVSYILYGISHDSFYDFRANEKETQGDFRHYVNLRNTSGENLDGAVLRFPQMEDMSRSMDSGETRRFLAQRVKEMPVEKLFVAKPQYDMFKGDEGEGVALVYELKNTSENGLGKMKLPDGKVRIFGDDGMDSSIFLGEDMMKATAPKEAAELTLGEVKDVVLKRHLMKDEQTNRKTNNNKAVILFDQVRQLRYEIENFKNEEVTLKIHEPMNGEWEITEITEDGVKTERKSINELILYVDLPPAPEGEAAVKKEVVLTVTIKNQMPGR